MFRPIQEAMPYSQPQIYFGLLRVIINATIVVFSIQRQVPLRGSTNDSRRSGIKSAPFDHHETPASRA